jgi:penicillin G amidase
VSLHCSRRALALLLFLSCLPAWATLPSSSTLRLDVQKPAQIVRDRDGIPHIFAGSELDLAYLTGYAQARDRLFQLDTTRRQADGTLAELLGGAAVPGDVMLRTVGLRRAAERSLPLASPEVRAALAAYARGINDYVAANPLPPEYAALEITRWRPWSELDSITCLKFFTFPAIDELERTMRLLAYQSAGAANAFDGTLLYLEDTDRAQPFDPAATMPDALAPPVRKPPRRWSRGMANFDASHVDAGTLGLAREFMQRLRESPLTNRLINPSDNERGSNAFVVSSRFSLSGEPLMGSDPHLPLTAPAFFYQAHLQAPGVDVIGGLFAGIPYVLIGHNDHVTFTATNSLLDVSDVYSERVVRDTASPSGWSTLYQGRMEPLLKLPQAYLVNTPGDGTRDNLVPATGVPAEVWIAPRRNDGPLIQFDPEKGTALSLQWTGHSGTREFDAFRGFNRARNIDDFARAVEFFDAGQQNFLVADIDGNIAYFLSGEVPLREDLQAGRVVGLPPTFIRNGQGGNEWLRAPPSKDPTRALRYQIIPSEEMPRLINPPRGYIVNANNDPTGATRDNDPFDQMRPGGGIFYLGGALFDSGIRAGRIDELLGERIQRRGRLTTNDVREILADTVMNDARVFTPYIVDAMANARQAGAHPLLAQLASDPRVAEAVARLAAWDQSTPTGIRAGYDANDEPGHLREPSPTEVKHSIAATIFSVWRNQFLKGTLVATLDRFKLPVSTVRRDPLGAARSLLESFDERKGIGASGLNFFDVPGVDDAAARRDIVILRSVAQALTLLSGDAYADVFKRSTHQEDYRWGKLHRVMLDHPLGAPFSIPPAGGAFPAPLAADGLPGIPFDGGNSTVDAAGNRLLDDSPGGFVIRAGPSQRYVARARIFGKGFDGEMSLPGGESGVLGSPFYVNLLEQWLTNRTHPLRHTRAELAGDVVSRETIVPAGR